MLSPILSLRVDLTTPPTPPPTTSPTFSPSRPYSMYNVARCFSVDPQSEHDARVHIAYLQFQVVTLLITNHSAHPVTDGGSKVFAEVSIFLRHVRTDPVMLSYLSLTTPPNLSPKGARRPRSRRLRLLLGVLEYRPTYFQPLRPPCRRRHLCQPSIRFAHVHANYVSCLWSYLATLLIVNRSAHPFAEGISVISRSQRVAHVHANYMSPTYHLAQHAARPQPQHHVSPIFCLLYRNCQLIFITNSYNFRHFLFPPPKVIDG